MNIPFTRAWLKNLAGSVLAILVTIAILVWFQRLWRVDLAIPINYVGDAVFYDVTIKAMLDNGWYLHNDYLGMPSGSDLHDFPLADSLHYGVMKLLSLASANHAVVFNLYYLLTYPVTTVLSLLVFRRFGLSYGLALAGSLVYTFLPYHFWRGQVHLLIACYYLVPLMVLLLLWLCTGRAIFFRWDEQSKRSAFQFLSWNALAALVICTLIGCGGIYYAFFGCCLLIIAGAFSYLTERNSASFWSASFCIALIVFVLFLNAVPTLVYRWEHGANAQAMQRDRADPETYALKIVQLLLPVTHHRFAWLAELKAFYNAHFHVTDNDSATLGILGSAGFLLLIGRLLYRSPSPAGPRLMDSLSVLNAFAVLLATMGGFGSLLSLAIGPSVRGYSRVSVYIAFFSIFALLLVLEKLRRRLAGSRLPRVLPYAIPMALAVAGIADQTNRAQIPQYAPVQQEYQNDDEFVKRIEATLPPNAMIFQLPYSPFPEGQVWTHQMVVYDPARAYLHSKALRWSYGAMCGREADLWQQSVALLPPERFLEAIVQKRFEGLYLDRNAYPDHGASLETQLSALLNAQPVVSANGRLAFFDLRNSGRCARR